LYRQFFETDSLSAEPMRNAGAEFFFSPDGTEKKRKGIERQAAGMAALDEQAVFCSFRRKQKKNTCVGSSTHRW
jgi:hypothetical protein